MRDMDTPITVSGLPLPCPFCGSQAESMGTFSPDQPVRCTNTSNYCIASLNWTTLYKWENRFQGCVAEAGDQSKRETLSELRNRVERELIETISEHRSDPDALSVVAHAYKAFKDASRT